MYDFIDESKILAEEESAKITTEPGNISNVLSDSIKHTASEVE